MDFCLLPKLWEKISKNITKKLSRKYSQKLLDHTKKPETDAMRAISKRAIHKGPQLSG